MTIFSCGTHNLFLRKLMFPCQDLPFLPKYLVTFTVGIHQKDIVNEAVLKVKHFSLPTVFALKIVEV